MRFFSGCIALAEPAAVGGTSVTQFVKGSRNAASGRNVSTCGSDTLFLTHAKVVGSRRRLDEELVVFDPIVTLLLGRVRDLICASAVFAETTGPFEKL